MLIRELRKDEIKLLDDFLYEAIFIPEGISKPPKKIIETKELQVYVKDFGLKDGDYCFVSEVDNKVVGACWSRIVNDFGHIDDDTPSLAISLLEEYRNQGIGTKLFCALLDLLKTKYKRVSLSVQKANYAYKMYSKCGFEIYEDKDEEYIMVCQF